MINMLFLCIHSYNYFCINSLSNYICWTFTAYLLTIKIQTFFNHAFCQDTLENPFGCKQQGVYLIMNNPTGKYIMGTTIWCQTFTKGETKDEFDQYFTQGEKGLWE